MIGRGQPSELPRALPPYAGESRFQPGRSSPARPGQAEIDPSRLLSVVFRDCCAYASSPSSELGCGYSCGHAAALAARAVEEAISQAEKLLDAIQRAKKDLHQARASIDAILTELEQDVAEAKAVVEASKDMRGEGYLPGLIARAETAMASTRREIDAPRPNPVAILHLLERSAAKLQEALAEVRDSHQRNQRARSVLDQSLFTARSEVASAEDFISTRRGAIGREARTRLAEAQRHLEAAYALADTDPQAALTEAQQANMLAEQAGALAIADVEEWEGGEMWTGGGYSGGMGGAVLGGILVSSVFSGGGFGGMSGRIPGSFGGLSTRDRRGGGGRF